MKIPSKLKALIKDDIIDEVVCQLKSGKEADVYIVKINDKSYCAKVYKESLSRSFKKRNQYIEGRRTRNSRQQRAIDKKSRYGRQEEESFWQNTETNTLSLLESIGVRAPNLYNYFDGVIIMELVQLLNKPAPRLHDVDFTKEQAVDYYHQTVKSIVKMLVSGIIHGDMSEFNILLSDEGLVIIDFPQVVNAAANNQACMIFRRDANHLRDFFAKFVPELAKTDYAKEIWHLYQKGKLSPDTKLTGKLHEGPQKKANLSTVLDEIYAANEDYKSTKLFS